MANGVTAIVFDKMNKPYFLILKREKEWKGWEFPKGGVKEGETPEQAVLREIYEETGIKKIKIFKKLDMKKEFIKEGNLVIHDVFLVETSMNIPVNIPQVDREHSTYLWTDKEGIAKRLTWDNDKKIFQEALLEIK